MKKLILFAATIFALVSCSKQKTVDYNTDVTVKLAATPGDFDSVIVNIKQVIILSSGGRKTLLVYHPTDVLLFGAESDTLVSGKVPAGSLKEVGLILGKEGHRLVKDGISYDLKIPGGQIAPVKLNVPGELVLGIPYKLSLNFDVAQSIVTAGDDEYILNPVVSTVQ